MGEGADLAPPSGRTSNWPAIRERSGLYTRPDGAGYWPRSAGGQSPDGPGRREHSSDWQGLGVSILHRLLIETLLEGQDLPKPRYVHQVEEVVEGLDSGEFPLAALVMPATVEHIRSISEHSERMPAKSTYFYPKLLSGLVINPLE